MASPMKYNIKKELPALILIAFAIIISIIAYPNLNSQIVTHWNLAGEPNGWSSKNFFIIFFPSLLIFMYGLFIVLPLLDPKKASYGDFANTYINLKTLLIGALTTVYTINLLADLGYQINISQSISMIIGVMMIGIGLLMKNIKSNYFVGIRTPWTMSSTTVWEKTHKISVYFFSILGLSIIITPYLITPWNAIILTLGVLQMIAGTIIYSYLLYRREQNKK